MTELVYADATEADIAGIQLASLASWRATYSGIMTREAIEDFVTRNYTRAALLISIERSADIFLVAKDGERVVGFCHLGDRGGGPELYRLYLIPEYWRQGVGSHLLALMEQRLRERAIPAYRCFVHERNERARAFYARRGFVRDPSCDEEDVLCLRKEVPEM